MSMSGRTIGEVVAERSSRDVGLGVSSPQTPRTVVRGVWGNREGRGSGLALTSPSLVNCYSDRSNSFHIIN
jgi:hypothetical protein